MCYQYFTGYAAVRNCIIAAYCCLDNIYKLGYIVVSRLNIICVNRPSNNSPAKCVIDISNGVETVRDSGILEREVDVMPIGNLDDGQIVDAVSGVSVDSLGGISAV